MDLDTPLEPTVHFTVLRTGGRVSDISTTDPAISHFLDLVKMNRAYNTWISYAHDLQLFFKVVGKPPQAVTRADCLSFMKHLDQAGCADTTTNRRLAALSSLFSELHLLDPGRFPQNPVQPGQPKPGSRKRSQSLYRKQPQRIPDVLAQEDLRILFDVLPTWRDRTLVLLMWISCLRISEAVAIRFQDIECSRRSIHISVAKGNNPRTVFMDHFTFAALNRYLDQERRDFFPEVEQVFVALKGRAHGRPLTVNAVQKMLAYYAGRHGLPHLHAHLLRHTGITQLVHQGMPEPAIRQFVGHRSPDSLLPYLHLSDQFVALEFEHALAGLSPAGWLRSLAPGGAS